MNTAQSNRSASAKARAGAGRPTAETASNMRAIKDVEQTLTPLGQETSEQASHRIFETFCSMVDAIGAEPVFQSLQHVANAGEKPLLGLAGNALRKACMRSEGALFGKLYDAHMRILPMVVRGPAPSRFCGEMDSMTMHQVHEFLRETLRQRIPNGDEIYPLPLAYSYTMTEFAAEQVTRVHEILRAAFAGLQSHAQMSTAPSYIVTKPESEPDVRVDDELHDLTLPQLGLQSWKQRYLDHAASTKPIDKLHTGDWITLRLIPVVIMVPHGQAVPDIDGFGDDAEILGNLLSFSSLTASGKQCVDGEDYQVQIAPVGLYGPEEGPTVARLSISHSRTITDILRVQSELEGNPAVILNYETKNACLHVVFTDGSDGLNNQVHLPPGVRAQRFIEHLARDLTSLGFQVQVDLGDSMIRLSSMESLLLH